MDHRPTWSERRPCRSLSRTSLQPKSRAVWRIVPCSFRLEMFMRRQLWMVSGRILTKGKPGPEVVVGLQLSQPRQFDSAFKATTDQDGKYRITDVPAGSYQVAPVAPAFVISDVNKSWGQSLIITESDKVTGIDFDLVRGGVITGKVTGADGQSLVEERVLLLAADAT